MCIDVLQRVATAKEVLLELLEDSENGDLDRSAIEHVIALLPNT